MKTLLALGASLWLAFIAAPAQADTPDYLNTLQASARASHLADDPAWSDLLQYEPYPVTGRLRSLADDPVSSTPRMAPPIRQPNSTPPSPACSHRPAPTHPTSTPSAASRPATTG